MTRACLRRIPRRLAKGFTLLELMVTIAVVAILAAVAYPNMTALINSQRLSATTNELIAGLQIARGEAIRRNARVSLCRSTDGATCAGASAGAAWSGWAVLADTNGDGTPDSLLKTSTVPAGLIVNASDAITDDAIVFRPDGLARTSTALLKAAISVCMPVSTPAENTRLLTIESGSRISTKREGTGATTCNRPANP